MGVLEDALLYFNFISPKTGNYITHLRISSDEVMNEEKMSFQNWFLERECITGLPNG
jgi:hypothetical protein